MKINCINFIKPYTGFQSKNNNYSRILNNNTADTFVSFCGKANKKQKKNNSGEEKPAGKKEITFEDFKERVMGDKVIVIDSVTCERIEDKEEALKLYQKRPIYLLPKIKPEKANEKYWDNLVNNIQDEALARTFFNLFTCKEAINGLTVLKGKYTLDGFLELGGISEKNMPKVSQWLSDAGITNFIQLGNMLKTYINAHAKQYYADSGVEFIRGYGLLDDKTDMIKYPDLILDLLIQNNDIKDDQILHDKINFYTSALSRIKVSSIEDFTRKFAHLGENFNDFETITDVEDCIEEVALTYDKKISFLENIPDIESSRYKNASDFYLNAADIVDYIYEQNNGESLKGLEGIIRLIYNKDINEKGVEALSSHFNDYTRVSDQIDFFNFLKDCQIDPKDFSKLTRFAITPDFSPKDSLKNYTPIIKALSKNNKLTSEESRKIYTTFKDIINVIYKKDTKNTDYVEKFVKVVNGNKVNDSLGFLKLYNSAYQTNKKELTGGEIKDFLDLMIFAPNYSLKEVKTEAGKNQIEVLEKEKEQFREVKKEIESFLDKNQSSYFALDSALDIYKKYKKELVDPAQPISCALEEITRLEAANSEEYQYKKNELAKFSEYISDKDELIKILRRNEITLEVQDSEYRTTCLQLFELLKDPSMKEVLKFVIRTDFIKNSKSSLADFVNSSYQEKNLQEILKFCQEKNIKSIGPVQDFLRKNDATSNSCANLIKHIRRMPDDLSFDENCELIKNLQLKIQKKNFPLKITDKNILNLNIQDFYSKVCTPQIISALSCNERDTNIISTLPETFVRKNAKTTKFKIAREILKKLYSSRESYMGISRMFRIYKDDQMLQSCSKRDQISIIKDKLPDEFVDFINSDDWIYRKDRNFANLSLHAKLRLIDRFIFKGTNNPNYLYTEEAKNKLLGIQKEIYENMPKNIEMTKTQTRYKTYNNFNDEIIETVFTKKGEMVTIVPKGSRLQFE